MSTTRSPGRCSRAMPATMSSIESASRADEPLRLQVAHQLRHRQAFGLRQLRAEDRRDEHLVGAGKRAREIVLEHAPARRRRARLEHRPDARVRVGGAQPGERFRDGGRMVREVVVHRHAVRHADDLEPPLDAGKGAQSLGNPRRADADFRRHRDRRGRIAHVVGADQRQLEHAERHPAAPHVEPGRRAGRLQIVGLPVHVVGRCRTSRRATRHCRPGPARPGCRRRSAAARLRGTRLTSRRNASVTASKSAIDVRVIELDVVDDGDVGQVLQELRGLVEEGAVVLVALDDEVAALPDPVAGAVLAEIARDAADEHARIDAAVRQQPAGQRRRGRLAVRAGDARSTARPRESVRESLPAASSSGSCDRAPPRAPGCRARSRCRRRRDRGRR